ncbi:MULTISPECIES: PLP-dependent cysteine synthase family protein [Vibrio]|jgi:cystathionine beta-synthase/cysteine synthase A|uniref:PLP-dependent cysteine synthase family protein n=1 Tax=Vibrio TaxID=662 RepID=UPI000C848AEA|nr:MULTISPECIES: pyridoxal-phosphate dependent enzyme [Vibrio]PMO44900.1 hypothetical protein BCT11_07280 [Vibrio sp. 10N.222.52.B12]
MECKNTLTKIIGNNPIVKINTLKGKNDKSAIYCKLEGFNPGGSIKDRTAIGLIRWAEEHKSLEKGGIIVEASSGNLGVALAMLSANMGYNFVCVVDPKASKQNILAMKAYGARVIVSTEKDKNGSYQIPRIKRAKMIATELNGIYLDQYSNGHLIDYHHTITGYEIYKNIVQSIPCINVLVGCVSTGSHLSGISLAIKEQIKYLKTIGVEPIGSVIFGGHPAPFLQNGTGLSFKPGNYIDEAIDVKKKVSDIDAFNMVRTLAKDEGILLGGSSGSAVHSAHEFIKESDDEQHILVICPDLGHKYLDTIYNDEWFHDKFSTVI